MLNNIGKKIQKLDFTIGSILASFTLLLTLMFCYLLTVSEYQENKVSFFKEVLENTYYLSQIILVFIAIVGLIQLFILIDQLEISKADIEIRSKREARILSLQICQKYEESILPNLIKINKFMDDRGVPKIDIKTIKNNQYDSFFLESWLEEWYFSIKIILFDINKALSDLDSFSAYFIRELADEEIGFSLIGHNYCKAIENLFLFIYYARIKDNSLNRYKNISNLYELWSCKIGNLEYFKLDPIGTTIDGYLKNEVKR